MEAQFIFSDIDNFWEAYDQMKDFKNPFSGYIEKGSPGLVDFIPYRIESAKNLKRVVKRNSNIYESVRDYSNQLEQYKSEIISYYQNPKELYSPAVFPPTYFVMGALNSGCTASDNGLIIGVDVAGQKKNIPIMVAHELIHLTKCRHPIKLPYLIKVFLREQQIL